MAHMTKKTPKTEEPHVFPILKGESVGRSGEFTGRAVVVVNPKSLKRRWASDEIPVLGMNLEKHLKTNARELNSLFTKVSAVLAEFGESIGEFASVAYAQQAIGIIKVQDASHVLETDMHIRLHASENLGEVFFIS
ncbi:MAG: hypothetical protein C4K47_09970 [Candidatus Thorarchaeota archaeon]|nr:MAG: hypothetical protein C4K47_09970 [Candidatus Thorarchaeota archaeon]